MFEELNLQRPLVFFDIESTGTNPLRDRIVEISVVKLLPGGDRQSNTRRVNPTIPIPKSASDIHGITDADVADEPTFDIIAPNLLRYLENCDLAGYNIAKFDIPLLQAEFSRSGLEFKCDGVRVVDVFNIFCKLYPRNLGAAYEFFCGKKLENAHSALADTVATLEVFAGQLAKHTEIPRDLDELNEFCNNSDPDAIDRDRRFKYQDGEAIVNFGKNSGRKLAEIAQNDPGFLKWIIRSDFAPDTKEIAQNALIGKFPEKKPDAGAC